MQQKRSGRARSLEVNVGKGILEKGSEKEKKKDNDIDA